MFHVSVAPSPNPVPPRQLSSLPSSAQLMPAISVLMHSMSIRANPGHFGPSCCAVATLLLSAVASKASIIGSAALSGKLVFFESERTVRNSQFSFMKAVSQSDVGQLPAGSRMLNPKTTPHVGRIARTLAMNAGILPESGHKP